MEAAGIYCYRDMIRTLWKDKNRSEDAMKDAERQRVLIIRIRRIQYTLFEHTTRRQKIDYFSRTVKLEGNRGKGRRKELMLYSLT